MLGRFVPDSKFFSRILTSVHHKFIYIVIHIFCCKFKLYAWENLSSWIVSWFNIFLADHVRIHSQSVEIGFFNACVITLHKLDRRTNMLNKTWTYFSGNMFLTSSLISPGYSILIACHPPDSDFPKIPTQWEAERPPHISHCYKLANLLCTMNILKRQTKAACFSYFLQSWHWLASKATAAGNQSSVA